MKARHHSMFLRPFLDYANRHLTREQLLEVLDRAGLTEAEIDGRRWIDASQVDRFCDAMVDVSGDPDLVRKVGKLFMTGPYTGLLRPLLRVFGSPKTMLSLFSSVSQQWTTAGRYEMHSYGDHHAKFSFVSSAEGSIQICHGRVSQIRWLFPAIFGLGPADVEHPVCMHRDGGDRCTYHIRWHSPRTSFWRLALSSVIGVVLGGLAMGMYAAVAPAVSAPLTLGTLFALLGLLLGLVLGRMLDVEQLLLDRAETMLEQDIQLKATLLEERKRIAQLRDAQTQLSVTAERAARANEVKDQFLAGMSHELRTPLSQIIGFIELEKEAPAEEPELLDNALASAHHLLGIIDNLLSHVQLKGERLQLEWRRQRVVPIIQDVVDRIRPEAAKKNINVQTSLEAITDVEMWLDEAHFALALFGLLDNAAKFTGMAGTIEVVGRLDSQEADEFVTLEVRDTGIGIAPENLKHIFRMFFMVDATATRTYGGAGLGLTVSRDIAEAMNGTLTVASEGLEKGTKALLRLPTE